MNIHEFGDKNKPVIILLPGTMCYWRGNFENVLNELLKDFLVAIVAYTGFDETDTENYTSVMDEIEKIENYIKINYNGSIKAIYGCSLGGTFVTHLISRNNIQIDYAFIGSSDLDQSSKFKANILANILIKLTYNFIHTGSYKTKLMQKRYKKQMNSSDPYNKAFVQLIGREKYDMSFITKESIKNQLKSDLTTPLPVNIDNGKTKIHIFYAKKMGKKYLKRYKKHFKNPIIHEQNLRHEELLALHPKEWCKIIKKHVYSQ